MLVQRAELYRGTSRRHGRSSGVSVLLVVSRNSNIMKLSRSLAGVDVKAVDSLNIMDLLPGSKPIRLTMYSQNAVDALGKFNESRPELEKKSE